MSNIANIKEVKNIINKIGGFSSEVKQACVDYLNKSTVGEIAVDVGEACSQIFDKFEVANLVAKIANALGCKRRGISHAQFEKHLTPGAVNINGREINLWNLYSDLMPFSGIAIIREILLDSFDRLPEEGNVLQRKTTYRGTHLNQNQSAYVNEAYRMIMSDIRPKLLKLMEYPTEYNNFSAKFIDYYSNFYPNIDIHAFMQRVYSKPAPTFGRNARENVDKTYDWLGGLGLGDRYPGLNAEKNGEGIHPLIYALNDNLDRILKSIENTEKQRKRQQKRVQARR